MVAATLDRIRKDRELSVFLKRIQINPVRSDTMMESVRKGDSEALASEIARVILCRRRG